MPESDGGRVTFSAWASARSFSHGLQGHLFAVFCPPSFLCTFSAAESGRYALVFFLTLDFPF